MPIELFHSNIGAGFSSPTYSGLCQHEVDEVDEVDIPKKKQGYLIGAALLYKRLKDC